MACLESVAALAYDNVTTILVDNGSEPPLVEPVRTRFPNVAIIRLPANGGFAVGYNAGLRHALANGSEFMLLLNNDTELAPDCLNLLVNEIQTATDIGLVTAKVYYQSDPQRIWTVGNRLNVFLDITDGGQGQPDIGQWNTPRDIDFAPFCAVLLRREAVERTGLLDEGFFLYYEDLDYCRRLQSAGYRLRLRPDAHVRHAVSASSGGKETPILRFRLAQSSGRYFRKHGRGARMLLIVPFRLASAIKLTARLLLTGHADVVRAYWAGLLAGWRSGKADQPPPKWLKV